MPLWLLLTAVLLLIPLAGVLYQTVGAWRDRRKLPPPGRLVPAAGGWLHIRDSGEGGPTVVLEAGVAASSLSWSLVHPKVEQFTRVVSYDRAGLGWSGPHRTPRTAMQCASELRKLLQAASVPGPFIIVGHSFGGYVARAFAALFRDETAGVVLVDAITPGEWQAPPEPQQQMLERGVVMSRRGAWLARFGVVRLALDLMIAGARGLPRLFANASTGNRSAFIDRIIGEVRKLPQQTWPAVRAHWCLPKSFLAMADHLRQLPASAAEVALAEHPEEIPLIILTAGDANPMRIATWQRVSQAVAESRHVVVTDAGHWLQLDRPDLVVSSIRDLVRLARRKMQSA